MKKILILAAALVGLTATAQQPGAQKRPLKPVQVPVHKMAPVSAKDFSYAMGVLQAEGVRQFVTQQGGVKAENMPQVVEALTANYTPEETARIEADAARAMGLRVAEINKTRLLPQMNEQATGDAEAKYLDLDIYNAALADALSGKKMAYDADSAMHIINQQMEYQKETYRKQNEDYLTNNAKAEGWKTTPSGLQYRVLTQGTGPMPADTSKVEVNYEGRLISGKVFDSSYKRGQSASFPVNGVIKGWQEALKMMPEGSKWELAIPQEIGYGERGTQGIPPYSTLLFTVELLKANTK